MAVVGMLLWTFLGGSHGLEGFEVLGMHERTEGQERLLVVVLKVQAQHLRPSAEELDRFNATEQDSDAADREASLQLTPTDYVLKDDAGSEWNGNLVLLGSGNNVITSDGLFISMNTKPNDPIDFGIAFAATRKELRLPLTLQFGDDHSFSVPDEDVALGEGPVSIPNINVPEIPNIHVPNIEVPNIQVPNVQLPHVLSPEVHSLSGTEPARTGGGEQRGIQVGEFVREGVAIDLADVTITAAGEISTLRANEPKQQPEPGHGLVVLKINITARRAGAKIATSQFGLLAGEDVLPVWGTFGSMFPGAPLALMKLDEAGTTTEFLKADTKQSLGLVFMLPEDQEILDYRFLWDVR